MTPLPSQEYLLDCFEHIGSFLVWLERPREHFITEYGFNRWNPRNSGNVAGCKNNSDGYVEVSLNGIKYKVHRIIYKMHTGIEPDVIDHKNRVRWDNRFENLRSGTHLENCQNRTISKRNSSGHTNIYHRNYGWEVIVRHKQKAINLGIYATLEEAVQIKKEWDAI